MKKFWIVLVIIIVLLVVGYLLLAKQHSEQQQHTPPQATAEKTVAKTTTEPETEAKPQPALSQEERWCKTLQDPQARARACKIAQQRRAIHRRH